MVARHCAGVRRMDCPSARAIPTPSSPEIRYRRDRAKSGYMSATMMRADVKAEDHIMAKTMPMRIALMSMVPALLRCAVRPFPRSGARAREQALAKMRER